MKSRERWWKKTASNFSTGTRLLLWVANESSVLSKADAVLEREKNFYRVISIVKYSYLPTDTFRKHVEMDVTCRKLALKFTGYGRQTR